MPRVKIRGMIHHVWFFFLVALAGWMNRQCRAVRELWGEHLANTHRVLPGTGGA